MKQIAAGEFKAQCLAIMDRVSKSGEPVVITKHGKPMVKLDPAGHTRSLLDGERFQTAVAAGFICDPKGPTEFGRWCRHNQPLGAGTAGAEWPNRGHGQCGNVSSRYRIEGNTEGSDS